MLRLEPTDDKYGKGELPERVEARVAALLGKEAATWFPSGTMAQQIALRIHSDARGRKAVAFHPHCHLDVHEERGYAVLHGLHAVLLGSRNRLFTLADLEQVAEPLAAVLVELPQRDLGGQLPSWDELVAITELARAKGAAVHMDGARLWQCGPFYGRALAEIAALFDTVYVSLYKDLGAGAGCMLAGPAGFVAESQVWRVRHGGRMYRIGHYLEAAERGLDEVLPRMPDLVAHAQELAAALVERGAEVVPDPPQTAMLHALRGARRTEWTVQVGELETPVSELADQVLGRLEPESE
ncbi:MAG TPA: beta-eliminating lyase-related protein [Gaiellaceae bacterium]|nr:beta-eliminating lyase-related protein [Gaiellaceae bacterium]